MTTLNDFTDDSENDPPQVTTLRTVEGEHTSGVVGELVSVENREFDRAYISEREEDEHLMRMYDGYGISDDIVGKLREFDVRQVFIHALESEGWVLYEFSLRQYRNSSLTWRDGPEDLQRFVKRDDALDVFETGGVF